MHRHDGLFMRGGLGPSVVWGTVIVPQYSSQLGPTQLAQDRRSFGSSIDLSLGGTPAKGLVLGGGILGFTGSSSPVETGIYAMAGWYPDPTDGFNVQTAVGSASGQSASGAFVSGGAGYELWVGKQWSLGAFARYGFAAIGTSGVSGDAQFVTIAVEMTLH